MTYFIIQINHLRGEHDTDQPVQYLTSVGTIFLALWNSKPTAMDHAFYAQSNPCYKLVATNIDGDVGSYFWLYRSQPPKVCGLHWGLEFSHYQSEKYLLIFVFLFKGLK